MIRVSTRAEIRHLHLVEGVTKKEVARRLGVNIKTVRRHVGGDDEYPVRRTPKRGRRLDDHRAEVLDLIEESPRISAKRIGRLLEQRHGLRHNPRTVRRFVQEVRGSLRTPEPFIHRTHVAGETMEVDFGESSASIDGRVTKVFFFVATLPASNSYFAKAYGFQRVECLLDGITSAMEWFGGLPTRVVFDNASMAVKKILKGEERVETRRFHSYRSEWPLGADFCSPASGWEKGSVERGVEYVRGLMFRPMASAASLDELNAALLAELEIDLDRRALRDGRTARAALDEERVRLRPLPEHRPSTARTISVTADKYGHVRVDRVTYSVPSELARRTLTAHLHHDRIEIAADGAVVASHPRSASEGEYVLALEHVLDALEKKPRAASEATVIRQIGLPDCFETLRSTLRQQKRRSDKEWVQIVGLLIDHPLAALQAAVDEALTSNAPGLGSIQQILRRKNQGRLAIVPLDLSDPTLAQIEIAPAELARYGSLVGSSWTGVQA